MSAMILCNSARVKDGDEGRVDIGVPLIVTLILTDADKVDGESWKLEGSATLVFNNPVTVDATNNGELEFVATTLPSTADTILIRATRAGVTPGPTFERTIRFVATTPAAKPAAAATTLAADALKKDAEDHWGMLIAKGLGKFVSRALLITLVLGGAYWILQSIPTVIDEGFGTFFATAEKSFAEGKAIEKAEQEKAKAEPASSPLPVSGKGVHYKHTIELDAEEIRIGETTEEKIERVRKELEALEAEASAAPPG